MEKIYEIPRARAAWVLCAGFLPVKSTVLNLVCYYSCTAVSYIYLLDLVHGSDVSTRTVTRNSDGHLFTRYYYTAAVTICRLIVCANNQLTGAVY